MSEKEIKKLETLKELIIEHPEYIRFVKNKYLTDDILLECLNTNPDIFCRIKDPSMTIINAALELDGGNLRYIDEKRRNVLPLKSISIAMESDIERAIDYINFDELPMEMQIDAFLENPDVVAPYCTKVPDSYIEMQIQKTPNIIKHIKNPTDKMKCIAISMDPNTALYFKELSDEMMDIIDEKYPWYIGQLPNYTRKNKDGE